MKKDNEIKAGDKVSFTFYYQSDNGLSKATDEKGKVSEILTLYSQISTGRQYGVVIGKKIIGIQRKATRRHKIKFESIDKEVFVVAVDKRTNRYVPIDSVELAD